MSSWLAESRAPALAPVPSPSQSESMEPRSGPRSVAVYELGVTRYEDALDLQRHLQARRREGPGADALLLTEHEPVLTLGRSHPDPDLRVAPAVVERLGIPIVQTERGGDITYHGPGQLVAYGIIDLRAWGCGVVDYVDGLEETVIGVLGDWGLPGEHRPGARGVWVRQRKIASLGVNVRRSVTMHGIALNVDQDLTHFALINPCGLPGVEMTSLSGEAGKPVLLEQVRESFVYHFGRAFGCHIDSVTLPGAP